LAELSVAVKKLGHCDDLSILMLRNAGVSERALQQAIVVEFGSKDAVFDAILPDLLVVKGETLKVH